MCFPLIRQFFARPNGLQTLIDPIGGVPLLSIGLQRSLDCDLRIDRFFDSFPANLRKPQLERFRFFGWNGLDQPQKLLGIGNISGAPLAVLCK